MPTECCIPGCKSNYFYRKTGKKLPEKTLVYRFPKVTGLQHNIGNAGGELKAIICDGNQTNQAFFKRYNTFQDQPWKTIVGTYILYVFVRLLKILRNLRLTEQAGELMGPSDQRYGKY